MALFFCIWPRYCGPNLSYGGTKVPFVPNVPKVPNIPNVPKGPQMIRKGKDEKPLLVVIKAEVSPSIRKDLKTEAVRRGITMKAAIIQAIELYLTISIK